MKTLLLVLALAAVCSGWQGCTGGYINIAGGCYRFHQDWETWWHAKKVCSSENAKLVSVLTYAQYNGLLAHMNGNYPGTYWTSGAVISGHWTWTGTGGSMNPNWWGWKNGNYADHCAYFCSNTLKYWSKPCSTKLRYICEKH
ncbi:asialoglycoprotein receptor 1 [Cherax quadricarinatus]|uniref:asialoglycoprotein receptor 1 n=1 Tax=Cherax quadricarinatus TaxID=27406 RepID=UPI00387EAF68